MQLKASILRKQPRRDVLIWIIVLTILAGIVITWCAINNQISAIDEKLEMLQSIE